MILTEWLRYSFDDLQPFIWRRAAGVDIQHWLHSLLHVHSLEAANLVHCVKYGEPSPSSLSSSSQQPTAASSSTSSKMDLKPSEAKGTSSSSSSSSSSWSRPRSANDANADHISRVNTEYEQLFVDHLSCRDLSTLLWSRVTSLPDRDTPPLMMPRITQELIDRTALDPPTRPPPIISLQQAYDAAVTTTSRRATRPNAATSSSRNKTRTGEAEEKQQPHQPSRLTKEEWCAQLTPMAYVHETSTWYNRMRPPIGPTSREVLLSYIRTETLIDEVKKSLILEQQLTSSSSSSTATTTSTATSNSSPINDAVLTPPTSWSFPPLPGVDHMRASQIITRRITELRTQIGSRYARAFALYHWRSILDVPSSCNYLTLLKWYMTRFCSNEVKEKSSGSMNHTTHDSSSSSSSSRVPPLYVLPEGWPSLFPTIFATPFPPVAEFQAIMHHLLQSTILL
jgi:hypothetical protein